MVNMLCHVRGAFARTFVTRTAAVSMAACLVTGAVLLAQAPVLDKTERVRAKDMLDAIRVAIRDNYYDQTFRGRDLNAHFKESEKKIDTAVSLGHAYAIIAQTLIDFDDSHTFFIPPDRPAKYEYGWKMGMVGDECLVVAVKPGSDAAAKGLKPGDRLLQVEAFTPSRAGLWKAKYLYHVLSPRTSIKLLVQSPGGQPRPMELAAKVTPKPKQVDISIDNLLDGGTLVFEDDTVDLRSRVQRVGDVAIWKLPSFGFKPDELDRVFDEVVKGASALVLDLRGNPGGYVKTLEQLAGRLFDHDVKIADVKGRKSSKASIAKKRKNPFMGKIVVIVDADSASAAEVLARVIQLQERGTVIGDRSSGSVMQGVRASFALGVPDASEMIMIPYGASITNADLIMTDGKSLEHVGVTPDVLLLPATSDLAAGLDPVLARAAALAGATMDPATAGKLFPIEWK